MDLKKHITEWFDAIDRKDFAALEAKLDPKHSFTNSMTPQPADVKNHLELIKGMLNGLTGKHTLDVIVTDGHEWVCVRGRWSGKHTGEFSGIPATNKNIEFSWIDMQRVVNDKVVDEYMELNPASIMQQIGVVPATA